MSLTRAAWLDVLSFLTQTTESSASEEIAKTLTVLAAEIRSIVLAREIREEYPVSFHQPTALDFYLHLHEFAEKHQEPAPLRPIQGKLKSFLLRSCYE